VFGPRQGDEFGVKERWGGGGGGGRRRGEGIKVKVYRRERIKDLKCFDFDRECLLGERECSLRLGFRVKKRGGNYVDALKKGRGEMQSWLVRGDEFAGWGS